MAGVRQRAALRRRSGRLRGTVAGALRRGAPKAAVHHGRGAGQGPAECRIEIMGHGLKPLEDAREDIIGEM